MNPSELHPSLWRANQLGGANSACVPSGFPELDSHLPGSGWPSRNLTELLIKHHGIGELRFLIPCLRRLALEKKTIVFVCPPLWPVPHVFEQFGIPTERLVLVHTPKPLDKLWATEKIIQSDSFGASIIWLPEGNLATHATGSLNQKGTSVRLLGSTQLRRLQHHAQRSEGLSFVFRTIEAQHNPSPAALRLCLTAQSADSLKVHIIKRRGPTLENPFLIDLPNPQSALPGPFETEATHTFNERENAVDRREHGPINSVESNLPVHSAVRTRTS